MTEAKDLILSLPQRILWGSRWSI